MKRKMVIAVLAAMLAAVPAGAVSAQENGFTTAEEDKVALDAETKALLKELYDFFFEAQIQDDNGLQEVVMKANTGDLNAIYVLECELFHGGIFGQDYERAYTLLKTLVDHNYAEAMTTMGYMYENGIVVEQNAEDAVYWYKKAAQAGSTTGMYNLGNCYRQGYGVEVDYAQSHEWMEKAAENGDADAMVRTGNNYLNGDGVDSDVLHAFEWYKKAADTGYEEGIYRAALVYLGYYDDDRIENNEDLGMEMINKLAARGNAKALYLLAEEYKYETAETDETLDAAIEKYRAAALAGSPYAMYTLGNIYEKGYLGMDRITLDAKTGEERSEPIGPFIDKDSELALFWYQSAYNAGYLEASEDIDRMKSEQETEQES